MSVTYYRSFKTHPNNSKAKQQRAEPRKEGLKLMPPAEPTAVREEKADAAPQKRNIFGYIFHSGPQALSVTVPGDAVPFRLGSHTVLSGLQHEENSPDVKIEEAGIYEIGYSVVMQAANAVHAALSVQADGQTVEGSVTARLIDTHEAVYSAVMLAELKAGTTLRLVITSGTAAGVQLSDSGVSVSLLIKKLD